MKVLIKSAKIFNSTSSFHLKTKDILIEKGKIKAIGEKLKADGAKVIEGKNLKVSGGWFDLYAVVREPGNESKDNLATLCDSAKLGGFTDLAGISGSNPALYSRAQIEYVKNQSKGNLVNIHPLGTITEKKEGENITELYDLFKAGALAFSDGLKHIKNPELLKRALLYVKPFGGKVMVFSEDAYLANDGMINEGEIAAHLGMKVRPAIAEEIALERNITLAEYTDSPLHIQGVSTAKSVEIIKKAKKKGLKITCDVHVANLLYNDSALQSFDTNFKVLPVLRTEKDRKALIKGLKEGIIDGIASGHTPQDNESKDCEFDHADFGMMTLETMGLDLFASMEKELGEEMLFKLLSEQARVVLNLPNNVIEQGNNVSLTVIGDEEWTFEKKQIRSVSKNNPSIGKRYQQKVLALISNGQVQQN